MKANKPQHGLPLLTPLPHLISPRTTLDRQKRHKKLSFRANRRQNNSQHYSSRQKLRQLPRLSTQIYPRNGRPSSTPTISSSNGIKTNRKQRLTQVNNIQLISFKKNRRQTIIGLQLCWLWRHPWSRPCFQSFWQIKHSLKLSLSLRLIINNRCKSSRICSTRMCQLRLIDKNRPGADLSKHSSHRSKNKACFKIG